MQNSPLPALTTPRLVQTVLGEIDYKRLGITDAHNHVWIDPIPGADPSSPVLDRYPQILEELERYRAAGGDSLLDCQPRGCGRNAIQLSALSLATGVNIIACTGFHRAKYYPPSYPLFSMEAGEVTEFLVRELTETLEETQDWEKPIRAGFIKIAFEADWTDCSLRALEGVAEAARQTGAMVEIHTEKGALAEPIVRFFEDRNVPPRHLVLCHMDKRPDTGLHAELARHGVLLEYDTFWRPKYDPEVNLWPLLIQMVAAGLSASVALATDMGGPELYQTLGGGPGLASLPGQIRRRLNDSSIPEDAVRRMLGENIARRLAGLDS